MVRKRTDVEVMITRPETRDSTSKTFTEAGPSFRHHEESSQKKSEPHEEPELGSLASLRQNGVDSANDWRGEMLVLKRSITARRVVTR
jgi:hypothetical protein